MNKLPDNPLVIEVSCETADEFLAESTLLHERFRNPDWWVFRGLSNSAYPLTPTALRKNELFGLPPQKPRPPVRSKDGRTTSYAHFTALNTQIGAEWHILRRFFLLADRAGLPLPFDSPRLRLYLGQETNNPMTKGWPQDEILGVLAQAQHYGLPTRLLDWSRDPLRAAYFAAIGATRRLANEKQPSGERITLWGFCVEATRHHLAQAECKSSNRIEIVRPPTESNPNLMAQHGLFTALRFCDAYDEDLDLLPFDKQVLRLLSSPMIRWTDESIQELVTKTQAGFLRLTLPVLLAPELAKKLRTIGVHAGSLFPGLKGIAESVEEERLLNHFKQ